MSRQTTFCKASPHADEISYLDANWLCSNMQAMGRLLITFWPEQATQVKTTTIVAINIDINNNNLSTNPSIKNQAPTNHRLNQQGKDMQQRFSSSDSESQHACQGEVLKFVESPLTRTPKFRNKSF